MGRRLEDKDQRLVPSLAAQVRTLRGDRDLSAACSRT